MSVQLLNSDPVAWPTPDSSRSAVGCDASGRLNIKNSAGVAMPLIAPLVHLPFYSSYELNLNATGDAVFSGAVPLISTGSTSWHLPVLPAASWTLTYGGQNTAPISPVATAGAVLSALQNLLGPGVSSVTSDGGAGLFIVLTAGYTSALTGQTTITIPTLPGKLMLLRMFLFWASTNLSATPAVFGIRDAANGTGNLLTSNSAVTSALQALTSNSLGTIVSATIPGPVVTTGNLFINVSTPHGSAATVQVVLEYVPFE